MTPSLTLDSITADALSPFRHGFFTRRGGASSGIFEGLNCGQGSSDMAEMVAINRDRVAEAMGVDRDALITLNQTHSATACTISAPPSERLTGDALVTATPGLVLAVLTADCQPVLFADREAGVVAAAHAGWRGARDGILEATLEAMEKLGARRADTQAVIGPSISQAAYEVGPEFFETFVTEDPAMSRFFAAGNGDRMRFDLPGFSIQRLREIGIGAVEWTGHCTYADPYRFYSYRRACHNNEVDFGRLISAIRL